LAAFPCPALLNKPAKKHRNKFSPEGLKTGKYPGNLKKSEKLEKFL